MALQQKVKSNTAGEVMFTKGSDRLVFGDKNWIEARMGRTSGLRSPSAFGCPSSDSSGGIEKWII